MSAEDHWRCSARLAALALLPGLLGAAACTTDRDHYGELTRAWQRAQPHAEASGSASDPLAGTAALERAPLVRLVLERNPTLAAAHATWRATLERYPQATALDDPVLGYGLAPRALGKSDFAPGHRIDLSQRLPFFGKRALRGAAALSEAEAAEHDFSAARLRLAQLASTLFDDYYLAVRALEINREHGDLLRIFEQGALARYESGAGSQQDPLAAATELARLRERALILQNELQIARARINTLLHRAPELPLPRPPARLEAPALPPLEELPAALQASAIHARPDLAAAAARVRAREAALAQARREFIPDVTVMGTYDALWEESDLRPFVGVEIELPLQLGRRRAALREARARLDQAQREADGLTDEVRYEVQRAREELERARRLGVLYRDSLLPAARQRLAAARIGFESGRNDFSDLIDAEHELRDVRLDAERALAEESRRSAELRAALGLEPFPGEEQR